MRSRERGRSSLRKGSIKKKKVSKRVKKEVRLELMISACYFLRFRKNQVFSKSYRPHLSVRYCALNKPPLMRELPLHVYVQKNNF